MKKINKLVNTKNLVIFFALLFIFLTLDYILIITYFSFSEPIKDTIFTSVIFIILKYLVLIGIFIYQYHDYLKEKWFDFKKNFKKYFSISFKYWFIGFVLMIVSNIIINSFFKGLGQNEESVQLLIKKLPIMAFFLTTIFAPVVEEMIFRKYLQDSFNNKLLFMIVSGFIFGFIHVMGSNNILEYLLIIPYGSLGFMFAKTLSETDNIYCTIMMHMFHNGILTLLSIWVIK